MTRGFPHVHLTPMRFPRQREVRKHVHGRKWSMPAMHAFSLASCTSMYLALPMAVVLLPTLGYTTQRSVRSRNVRLHDI